jgi:tellurite resistance protein
VREPVEERHVELVGVAVAVAVAEGDGDAEEVALKLLV